MSMDQAAAQPKQAARNQAEQLIVVLSFHPNNLPEADVQL